MNKRAVSCVDLFCGLGGLTYGLACGGIEVIAGIDIDHECQFPYETNNKATFIERDVKQVTGNEIRNLFKSGTYTLLAGCAPCQPYSTYSRKGRKDREDDDWELVIDFGRLVREVHPDFVTMENVPQLIDHKVFADFLVALDGYHIWYEVIECANYGVPQTRKRLVLLASRHGAISLIDPPLAKRPVTVRTAIGHLRPIGAGQSDPADAMHSACSLSDMNMQRIMASKPGGTWRDWSPKLRAKCHRRKTGATYPSVYGRMEWDAPAPTMTTQCFGYGNGRFGHPDQHRAISLREAAILQTFPDNYVFLRTGETPRFNVMGRLIGNAVPVKIGEVLASSIKKHIHGLSNTMP
jgi:DNA (cytosine-5)-methyltransferase 1